MHYLQFGSGIHVWSIYIEVAPQVIHCNRLFLSQLKLGSRLSEAGKKDSNIFYD